MRLHYAPNEAVCYVWQLVFYALYDKVAVRDTRTRTLMSQGGCVCVS